MALGVGGFVYAATLGKRQAVAPIGHRDTWRMPPLTLLGRPEWSRGRTAAMWCLRGYLVVAVVLLVVKAIQLGTGH